MANPYDNKMARLRYTIILLLFPLALLAQGAKIYKADLYTYTVTRESAVCERQRVTWGTIQQEADKYFCFAFGSQERCFKLDKKHLTKGTVTVLAEDAKEGDLYTIEVLNKDGFFIKISRVEGGLPTWVLTTHNICKRQLNFFTQNGKRRISP